MENYAILIGAMMTMLLASLVSTYFGFAIAGSLFFILALTPLPVKLAYRLRDLVPARVRS